MIDHVGLDVSDYDVSKRFFERALGLVGYRVVMDLPEYHAF